MAKVLLFHSSSMLLEKVLPFYLQEENEVTVVTTNPQFKGDETIEVIHLKKFSFLSWFDYQKKIGATKYDQAVVLYNNKSGKGYGNVDVFALLIQAEERFAYNYDRQKLTLSIKTYLVKQSFLFIGLLWFIVNSLLLFILFLVSLLVMSILELILLFLPSKNLT